MEAGKKGRGLGRVAVVSFSLCAAAVVAVLALNDGRMASAQAPDARSAPADTAIPGAGDEYIIPPDTDVGLPIPGPPGDGLLDEEFAWVAVYQPPGPPNNQLPLLCPRKKAPDNNQAAQVRAWGDPEGGDYYWSGGGWTATGPDPFFNSASTGDYIAHVHYVAEEGEADDDSGYIHVFDAELTLDGTPDNTEDSPGAFLAKGSARKLLTSATVPADPDDVMPTGFLEGQPHRDRAPYTVTLSRGGAVEIYSQPTGGQPLTGDALEWGWKYNPQTQKYVERVPQPYPPEVWVAPVSAGSGDLELTLIYRTVNECPGWAPDTGGSGTDRTTDRVKIAVIAVDLRVNGTTTPDDDYVVKEKTGDVRGTPYNSPAGATDNHIPLTAALLGPQGTTCHLLLSSSTEGGQVRFTKEDGTALPAEGVPITVGGPPANLRLYGTTASSALNDVVIQARTVETGDDLCGSEDLTVVWFDGEDLHFRGSDYQGQGLTDGSTATFTKFASWLRNQVGIQIYAKPLDWDWDRAQGQMEIRCQPKPNVRLTPNLTWDIKREWSCAFWGPGVGTTLDKVVKAGAYGWAYDDDPANQDEDLDQNDGLTSLFVIDGPGFGDPNSGLPYTDQCRFSWKSKFHEWIEVKIGGKWYVCSPYKNWRCIMHLEFKGQQEGWWQGNGINEIVPGTIQGFAADWNDD